jgi:hypothetical protein
MDRGDRASILCGDQDRNAIRRHDPNALAWRSGEHGVRARPIPCRLRGRVENIDPMNLHWKHRVFRGLSATLAESMFDTKVYENAIA